MRLFIVFQVFIGLFMASFSGVAVADPSGTWGQITKFLWGPPQSNLVRPYLETGKIPHNSRWADDEWAPQDWIDSRGSAAAVIDGFYTAGIITDQYSEDEIPVLEVGQAYIDLGDLDKRRVVQFVDHVYGVTEKSPKGVMLIYFHHDDEPVGLFNKNGLQFQ